MKKTVFAIILVSVFSSCCLAADYRQNSQNRQQLYQQKLQALKQEASKVVSDMDNIYSKIISAINSGQIPSDEDLAQAEQIVRQGRKFLKTEPFTEAKKSNYFILSSWLYYFEGKTDHSLKAAAMAQRLMPENTNGQKTLIVQSLALNDYESVMQNLTMHHRQQYLSRKSKGQNMPFDSAPQIVYRQDSKDELNFEPNTIMPELLGKPAETSLEPVDCNLPTLETKGRLICALLWQIENSILEKYKPKPAKTDTQNNPDGQIPAPIEPANRRQPAMMEMPAEFGLRPQKDKSDRFKFFDELNQKFADNNEIAFIMINLNPASERQSIANWLKANPQNSTVMLKPAVSASADELSDINEPVLVIISPDGLIRYAGAAEGFAPAMIIEAIKNSQPADSNLPQIPQVSAQKQDEQQQINTPAVETETDIPQPAENNDTAKTAAKKVVAVKEVDDEFFDPRAEQLLETARSFFKIGNRMLQYKSYGKPIEMCRTVMHDYPNTKYSAEAQMLLRNVPERYRARYKLTDEELGL